METENPGATFIPASQRPDGTWRKPRRVKDGYVPQDEVPLYESKGKQWAKNQPKLPVGMNFVEVQEEKEARPDKPKPQYVIPGLLVEEAEPANKADIDGKKKKKKKKKKGVGDGLVNEVIEKLSNTQLTSGGALGKSSEVPSAISGDQEEESGGGGGGSSGGGHQAPLPQPPAPLTELEMMEKRLRKLKDKLRDIEGLEKKIETKELKNPDKKQLEKIQRKGQILAEIEELVIEIELAD